MKKLILIKPTGNHSNRLIQNLNFEAFCKEYDVEFHNPTFNDLSRYYVDPCNTETNEFYKFLQINLLGKIFRHSRLVKRLFSIVWLLSKLGLLKYILFDKEIDEQACIAKLLKSFKKNDTVYVGGWWFRVPELTKKHKSELASNYSLKPSLYSENLLIKEIYKLKSEDYVIIGIHIRRGDYKKWKNGKYYFCDNVYKKFMNEISEQLSSKKKDKYIFILFSNEALIFDKFDNIIISHEKWHIDQQIMSLCDYLIGPPSTFSFWANYIGKGKLFHIFDKNQTLNIDQLD